MTDWDVAYWMAKYDKLKEDYGELREDYTVAEDRIAELESLTTGLAKNAAWMSMELEKYQWVSVDDKLPEDSGEYLVYIVANNEPKNKSIITLYYTNLSKRFVYYDNDNLFTVTHWCYLPEKPKE